MPEAARAPDVRFLLQHPAHFVALGGGLGLLPFAPGTFGTLLAFPLFWYLGAALAPAVFFAVIALLFAMGIWACERTGRALGNADHGAMVWDETVAFLLVLFFTPLHGFWPVFAFLVFRFFDIVKPPPIRYYERAFKGGFGVMIDDIMAAFYTLLVLAVARKLIG